MSLVGDIVIGFRDLAPDPCQSLNPPTATFATNAGSAPIPGLFPNGATAYMKVTQGTQWGETSAGQEYNQTLVAAFGFNVVATVAVSYLATFVRVYFSTTSGAEDRYFEVPIPTPTNSVSVIVGSVIATPETGPTPGVTPTIPRAWIPESDGNILSAARLYNWLNEGLNLVGQFTGGIRDVTGCPSTQGQAQYQLIGQWQKIDNNFYDGYPFAAGQKQQIFRHSNVVGLTGVGTVNMSSDRQLIETWPQSNRTSGQGVLTAPIGATDTTLNFTPGVNGFVLGFGLILLGTYPPTELTGPNSCELVYYSNLGSSSISQLTRGMGGTQPQAWPVNTALYEVNIFLSGKRQPQLYQRGQSAFTFTCPPAFEDAIRTYLIYRFKDAEQNTSEANTKFQLFKTICDNIKNMQQIDGPRQVQVGGTGGVEIAAGLGSPFGGVLIP